MSKRRISKQQSIRIKKRDAAYQSNASLIHNNVHENGLVITRFGSHALIECSNRQRLYCSIRPSISSLTAGDRVVCQEVSPSQGQVVSRHPRRNWLARKDKHHQDKVIAANLSQVVVVVAPKPIISWPLLDSYLVMTELLQLPTFIILNKTDLPCELLKNRLKEQYKTLGYELLFLNQNRCDTEKALHALLNRQISVFVGQSGVGKSTLISQALPLNPHLIQTQELSSISQLGKHTTSNSYYYHLPHQGALIDSPGVREFGLWRMPATEIAKGYRDFKPFLAHCKFRNCLHIKTPGCAVYGAVTDKKIVQDRYENYVKIVAQFAIQ